MNSRKLKEIEHSKKRRQILKGFERDIALNTTNSTKFSNLIKNKELFNKHFSNLKYYSITRQSKKFQERLVKKSINKNSIVLDFACGNGENAFYAARFAKKVIGIDISKEGIKNCKLNAVDLGLDRKCKFLVMDGEKMKFPDNYFDFCVEYGALHHVDLQIALNEIKRVLKPGGKFVFVEALRHNPFIHAYRRLTPHLRTKWEVNHILGVDSLKKIEKAFKNVKVKNFHLASIFAVPFRKTSYFQKLLKILEKIDAIILKNSKINKFAWIMIISGEK